MTPSLRQVHGDDGADAEDGGTVITGGEADTGGLRFSGAPSSPSAAAPDRRSARLSTGRRAVDETDTRRSSDARVHPVPEGTDEIMRLIVARGPAEVSG
ncbi:hypothetical protein [Streptomyces sp. NPDC001714]|uniref:hypothetical protein n=1 Tax=Streptomyces sp. NPDC001714 TaxID=3364603 RepID=UPI003682D207